MASSSTVPKGLPKKKNRHGDHFYKCFVTAILFVPILTIQIAHNHIAIKEEERTILDNHISQKRQLSEDDASMISPAGILGTTSIRRRSSESAGGMNPLLLDALSQEYLESYSQNLGHVIDNPAHSLKDEITRAHEEPPSGEIQQPPRVQPREEEKESQEQHQHQHPLVDRPFHSHFRDGNLLVIATAPVDERHVVSLWSQLECFTAGIDKIVLAVPLGSETIVTKLVAEMERKLPHLPDIVAHYVKNDRYDVGLWCDALELEGFIRGTETTKENVPFGNTLLLNDSVFALRHFNGILEELQDTDYRVVGLSSSMSKGYWLESIFRGFSYKGIQTFMKHSCVPVTHASFGPKLTSPVKKKRKIVHYHEIKLAYRFAPNRRTALYSADPTPNWWPEKDQNVTWVQNEKLWRTLKDQQRFPVAKVNQEYAVSTLDSPLIQPCTAKLNMDFVRSLDFASFHHTSPLKTPTEKSSSSTTRESGDD